MVSPFKRLASALGIGGGSSSTPTNAPIAVDELSPYAYAGQTSPSPWDSSIYDGGKFFGGFGATQLQHIDYWTLRARSSQLFNENLYARGLIRRLITNEINTGLTPEPARTKRSSALAKIASQTGRKP